MRKNTMKVKAKIVSDYIGSTLRCGHKQRKLLKNLQEIITVRDACINTSRIPIISIK